MVQGATGDATAAGESPALGVGGMGGGQNNDALMQLSGAARDDDVTLRCFVCRSLPWSLEERRPGRVRVVATRRQTTD